MHRTSYLSRFLLLQREILPIPFIAAPFIVVFSSTAVDDIVYGTQEGVELHLVQLPPTSSTSSGAMIPLSTHSTVPYSGLSQIGRHLVVLPLSVRAPELCTDGSPMAVVCLFRDDSGLPSGLFSISVDGLPTLIGDLYNHPDPTDDLYFAPAAMLLWSNPVEVLVWNRWMEDLDDILLQSRVVREYQDTTTGSFPMGFGSESALRGFIDVKFTACLLSGVIGFSNGPYQKLDACIVRFD